MGDPLLGGNVPEDWIGRTVVVLSEGVGESVLLGGTITLLKAEIYSGELRAVNAFGISLALLTLTRREKEEGTFYPGGDTFFPWNSVVRISLASP